MLRSRPTSRVVDQLPAHIHNDDPEKFRAQRIAMNKARLDAAGFGVGRGDSDDDVADSYHLARELEHVYDEIIQEQFAPAGAFEKFPLDQRVPPGATSHTVQRVGFTGEPRVYRSTDAAEPDRGRANVRKDEDSFPVRYYVQDIPLDFFDELHSDFAQSRLREELIEAAEITMERFATEKVWQGDDRHGIKGILNYPWLQKRALTEPFTENGSNDTIKDQVLRTEQFIIENSETRARPDRAVTSPRLANFLKRQDASPNYRGSLADEILDRLDLIDEWETDPDLENFGGDDVDGILFYTDNRRAIANVVPEPFSMLPVRERGSFDLVIPTYMSHGGIVMRDPWANALALAQVTD